MAENLIKSGCNSLIIYGLHYLIGIICKFIIYF